MIKTRGPLQVRTLPKLSVSQLYPQQREEINLNTCGDPDCGNYGVAADPIFDTARQLAGERRRRRTRSLRPDWASTRCPRSRERNASRRRSTSTMPPSSGATAAAWSVATRRSRRPARSASRSSLTITTRTSSNGSAKIMASSTDLGAALATGAVLMRRKSSPRRELNGKHPKTGRPLGIRVIHKDCPDKAKKGWRFTVSRDHQCQRDREDNIKILTMLVNGASINSIQRVLTDPRTGKRAGMSRICDRIFWLERHCPRLSGRSSRGGAMS